MANDTPIPTPAKRAFINITRVDTKPLARALNRIADALEVIVHQQYGYHMRPPIADTRGPDPTVDYSDDRSAAIQELTDLAKAAEPVDTPLGDHGE